MSVLIFLAILVALVFVHELGHFAVAKWVKMRVDEFGIGFPPKLFGIKKGETEYTLNALPIGGFVKIYGEDSVGVGENMTDGAFTSKSKWAQAAVLVAGVTMNVLFAWVLVAIAFGIGVRTVVSEADAGASAELTITGVLPGGPVAEAGIPAGSAIVSVSADGDTLAVLTPSALSAFVAEHPDAAHTIIYTDGRTTQTVVATPRAGLAEEHPEQPILGVALAQVQVRTRSLTESVFDSGMFVLVGLRDITVGIGTLVRDAVTLRADLSQVAGPVGIVGYVGAASQDGAAALLLFTAFISLNLAVINILPFPALDGGRLVMVGIEALKGSPIPARYVTTVNTIGFLILMLLMVAVTWSDIARLV